MSLKSEETGSTVGVVVPMRASRSLSFRVVALPLTAWAAAACVAPEAPPPSRIDVDVYDTLAALPPDELAARTLVVEFAVDDFAADVVEVADAVDVVARVAARERALIEGGAGTARALARLPYAFVTVDDVAGVIGVATAGGVAHVYEDVAVDVDLATSLPFIGQPAAAAAGATGAGTAVAVLDTGLDFTRAAFGACASAGAPGCRVVHVADFAPDDGVLDDNNRHGTNVAGIVAGVAPDTKLIGLDVFSGAQGFSSHILAAVDWVVANRATHNIVAMNLSLGGGGATAVCGNDVFASGLAGARAAGVLPIVASGNNAFLDRISSPACTPAAVSVGAVYDTTRAGGVSYSTCTDNTIAADRATCFSNTAPFLTIMAPGGAIEAAGITMSGTSQATPHVAGAVAVLAAAFPADSADARLSRLLSAARSVTDVRTGRAFPRLDVGAAVATSPCQTALSLSTSTTTFAGGALTANVNTASGCAWTLSSSAPWLTLSATSGTGPTAVTATASASNGVLRTATLRTGTGASQTVTQQAETSPPTGTVSFGVAGPLNTKNVTLTLSATDNAGVTTMCLSNTTTCTSFVAYATSKAWTLAPSGGTATVRAWFKDAAGNVSAPATATIGYDATAPTNPTLTAVAEDAAASLSWTASTDAGGVTAYIVVGSTAATAPACSTTPLYRGAARTFRHSGLQNGSTYRYRVCAVDAATNLSSGATASARPVPETTPPTGTVTIAGAPGPLNTTTVALTLSASDASGVSQMCISASATCTAFAAFATTKSFALPAGTGTRTVSVWFRDIWGNTTSTPATASIAIDTALPTDGTVSVTGQSGALALSWSGFADTHSGVAGYRVVSAPTTAPASCPTTASTASSTSTSLALSGLVDGTTYGVRVCAVDAAGNVSRGVVVSGRPAPEYDAPTGGTVQIAVDVSATPSVALTLSATDVSGVSEMCVTASTTCSTWKPYATSLTFALPAGTGTRTVRAWFRDRYKNTTATAATDTVLVDTTKPTNGTVTATPQAGGVQLSWSGFADTHSGIAGYVVVAGATAPANCTTGRAIAVAAGATSVVDSGRPAGTAIGYRVCALDVAGNLGTGTTKSATPQ